MKITFDFAKQQISLEGDEGHLLDVLAQVRQLAPMLPRIEITSILPSGVSSGVETCGMGNENGAKGIANGNGPASPGHTVRQFVRAIQLNNVSERIAAVAYFMKNNEGRQSFSPKEMNEWFGFCGFQKPAQMPVAVFDAKRKHGYTESAGHGQWKLSTNGENLVIGKLNQLDNLPAR